MSSRRCPRVKKSKISSDGIESRIEDRKSIGIVEGSLIEEPATSGKCPRHFRSVLSASDASAHLANVFLEIRVNMYM